MAKIRHQKITGYGRFFIYLFFISFKVTIVPYQDLEKVVGAIPRKISPNMAIKSAQKNYIIIPLNLRLHTQNKSRKLAMFIICFSLTSGD
jgi:hypothetical protein